MTPHSPTHIAVRFIDDNVAGSARLLWSDAPEICQAIVNALPFTVRSHHAIFSGSEIAAVTRNLSRLALVNPTSNVDAGDLAYTYLLSDDHDSVDDDFAEICWFYGEDATPSMATGPVDVSVFARFEDATAFFDVCHRMRLEGAKMIEVSCVAP